MLNLVGLKQIQFSNMIMTVKQIFAELIQRISRFCLKTNYFDSANNLKQFSFKEVLLLEQKYSISHNFKLI